jgi:hypothetical protein
MDCSDCPSHVFIFSRFVLVVPISFMIPACLEIHFVFHVLTIISCAIIVPFFSRKILKVFG